VDPLGGSYYIEKLTDEIEHGAQEYLKKIEALGGVLRAIETGYIQREIQESAYKYQQKIESGQQVVVGVNRYQDVQRSAPPPLLRIDPDMERAQVDRLRRLRVQRDEHRVKVALTEVERTARSDENLMPPILEAVKAYATVGEIATTLRGVFGEYRESVVI
jgi:methylmalonyl-CoA mutase, N-terminal domain